MAQEDLQVFLQEKLRALDTTLDVSPGSPADTQVIQPVLRRLGTDPFTVDIGLFLKTRINQEFPEAATREGDAISDLLIKAAVLLWQPVVRENLRIKNGQSFADPSTLTTEEADALGANLFSARKTGDFARGVARLYFAQAQDITVGPSNYFSSKTGLRFFPTDIQSIRVNEMLLNQESGLYYFDVSLIAEDAGEEYNISPNDLVAVAGIGAAVRVANKVRFRTGASAEDAVTYIDRVKQELSEKSLVTLRGIIAKISDEFSEVTRVNALGYRDPEMQRDVLKGGGLGRVLAGGLKALAISDGEGRATTRRVQIDGSELVDFTTLVGPLSTPVRGFKITLHSAFPSGSLPVVRDLRVRAVVDATTLDLEDSVLSYSATDCPWVLRREEITLSDIPGGILFPDAGDGTVSIPQDAVHIGGATDVYVRGTDFEDSSVVLSSVTDDHPPLSGTRLRPQSTTTLRLNDVVLGTDYSVGDVVYETIEQTKTRGLTLQVLDAPNAGSYRVLSVTQTSGQAPLLTVTPSLVNVALDFRWKITDVLDIDLQEPKETKISGSDMRTVQGTDVVDTSGGTDFDAYGAAVGDVLRVTSGGAIEGDYEVLQVLGPSYSRLQVNRNLPATKNGVRYALFRKNAEGGVLAPFVRISSIDLLDTSGQPIGTTIPYARPVDVRSRGFANVARGIKADLTDGILGIVTSSLPSGAAVSGLTLNVSWEGVAFTVTFVGANPISLSAIVAQVNSAAQSATAGEVTRLALLLDGGNRVGIIPVAADIQITGGTARAALFGAAATYTTRDVRSASMLAAGGWASLRPALGEDFDVVQVLDGTQVGFYSVDTLSQTPSGIDPLVTKKDFAPDIGRHIQVGARSLGVARIYFLEPTSFEVGQDAVLEYTADDGTVLRFLPDPTNTHQRIPALPSGVKPKDGATNGTDVFESSATDFLSKGIQIGDAVILDFVPLTGTVSLTDPVSSLHGKVLTLSLGGGIDKNVVFIHDNTAIPATSVTRAGVVDQINRAVGQTICALDGSNRLEFNPDLSVVLRGSASAGSANGALGFSLVTGVDQNNTATNAGTTYVVEVAPSGNPNRVRLSAALPAATRQQFKVLRQHLQRIVSTDMAKNTETPGLYYFDVQLISEGAGDIYNIAPDLPMKVFGYASDGYLIETENPSLTFSPVERSVLRVSRTIFEVGASDDPDNAVQLSGQNLQVNYQRSPVTEDVNSFLLAETERVICQSPLSRHLQPFFVRMNVVYSGGSRESDIQPYVEDYISDLQPSDTLESSDIQAVLQGRGATSITNPIELVAVVHDFDRSVRLERSKNGLNTGRLAAFIPDAITLTKNP